ncbi:MAG: glycosyltransferase family 39 protein, partial [Chloroflexi bacterium]|nr:glycosyltransferase family 39 protein [Chloroflexota bacterium]
MPAYSLGIFVILLLGWLLRLYNLEFQPLWWDEGYTVYFATLPLPDILKETAQIDHPPLYWIMMKIWGEAAGFGPWSMRVFSAFFGILTVALTYRLSRFFLPTWPAIVASLFSALAPFLLWHSREERMYSLVFTIALFSSVLALRLARGETNRRTWLLYGFTLGVGPLIHYFLTLLWPVHALLWLSQKRERLSGLGVVTAAPILSLPWLLFVLSNLAEAARPEKAGQGGDFLYRLLQAAGWGTGGGQNPLSLVEFSYRLAGSYSVGYQPGSYGDFPSNAQSYTFAIIFLIIVMFAGVFFFLRRAILHHDGVSAWFLGAFFLPLAVAYAIQQLLP